MNRYGTPTTRGRTRYRSQFEARMAENLAERRLSFAYERDSFPFFVSRWFTPDFVLEAASGRPIYVEAKGYFPSSARADLIRVKRQNPDLDLRIVFQRAHVPIYRGSATTRARWAEKHGFPWAEGQVPAEWLR